MEQSTMKKTIVMIIQSFEEAIKQGSQIKVKR
jgi:ABC-type proline/glycine betaine transport system ATPase subunit